MTSRLQSRDDRNPMSGLSAAARRERKVNYVVAEGDRLRGEWDVSAKWHAG